jgi:transposase
VEVLYSRCAGLDVHKDTVVACVRIIEQGRIQREVRTFRTTTSQLLELSSWLSESGCEHVAMEATGVYWKPVWHILEGNFELVLANARQVKNVPGRKTDVNDAQWIADLLAHGLIRSSYVPPKPTQELRDLTRTRKQLGREVVQHTQRIQKVLDSANVKLSSLLSDTLGKSSRAILEALIAGETDPETLADLASTRVKASREKRVEYLRGKVTDHHRFLLKLHLGQIDGLTNTLAQLDARIAELLDPLADSVARLSAIPGISTTAAQIILAELGSDMTPFPSAERLRSWAGLCPGSDESAGKRRSTRIRPGAPWLKPVLVQCAFSAANKRNSYFRALFMRLKARRGAKKAAVAVAASLLTTAYNLLRDGTCYDDLGASHFDALDKAKVTKRLVKRLTDLGLQVEVRPAA